MAEATGDLLGQKRVVLDTNVLVSALWSEDGKPADVFAMIPAQAVDLYVNHSIVAEYSRVLIRPKLRFSQYKTQQVLELITKAAIHVVAPAIPIDFADPDDKVFYEVAVAADAWLVTGNEKHFPDDPRVISPAEFLSLD
ncbi:MAG: putative toxin-antitoxin system toxin component, PIN family [Coriobacteriia bacterium]|nr:putative toxin-antitoxin system toxin component, PIN family [Coriobacteriia bacterium]